MILVLQDQKSSDKTIRLLYFPDGITLAEMIAELHYMADNLMADYQIMFAVPGDMQKFARLHTILAPYEIDYPPYMKGKGYFKGSDGARKVLRDYTQEDG